MKVFITWSGERSRALGEVLRGWFPAVIQAVKPYFSPEDVTKGARWSTEIANELDDSQLGIIVVTADNLEAPWIMFEAGALSKNLGRSKVCPVLFGVEPTDIKGPLIQFQAVKFEKPDFQRLVRLMNTELGDQAMPMDVLASVFEMWWPKLEAEIGKELENHGTDDALVAVRSERDMLAEILGLVRSMARRRAPLEVPYRKLSALSPKDLSVLSSKLSTLSSEELSALLGEARRVRPYIIRRMLEEDYPNALRLADKVRDKEVSEERSEEKKTKGH